MVFKDSAPLSSSHETSLLRLSKFIGPRMLIGVPDEEGNRLLHVDSLQPLIIRARELTPFTYKPWHHEYC